MHSKWLGRVGLAALVMGALGGSGATMGCAAERDPINRVQLNALPKSFFVGAKYNDPTDDPKFYARTMVINVDYGDSSSDWGMFTNGENGVSKIKWQITEDKLIGRIAFERVQGTDGKGQAVTNQAGKPLAQNDGLVVYEFQIKSQFDIRRDYNSQTGEESNVIVENSSDRPWVERDYIRVDFSKNLVTAAYDFDTMSLLGLYGGGIDYAPLEYDVQDPNDENAPVLDLDNGYFDVTNKVFANPKQIDLGDGFVVPSCELPNLIRGGQFPNGNCNPNEITLRHSFRRVVDKDYEPVDWDGKKFEAYGAFTTPMGTFGSGGRFGYARDYGLVDAEWHRFISRYNVWERAHYYSDPEHMTGATACKVDADCGGVGAVSGMSRCDVYNEKCTLPYADRKAKTVYWYYADKSPEYYYPATREATEEWDAAMRQAVVSAKYAECKRFTPDQDCGPAITGNWADEEDLLYAVKEVNACKRGEIPGVQPSGCNDYADQIGAQRHYADAVVAITKMEPMVVLCHSTVDKTDPEGCGKVGTVARLGDLRFNLITSIAEPQTNSPWGIMSDASDPETGEKVAASVNIWTHVNDLFSRGLIDTLRYINGELKTQDITDGKYIDNWVEAARTLNSGITPILSKDEREKRIAAAANTTVQKLHEAQALSKDLKGPALKASNSLTPSTAGGISNIADLRKALLNNMKRVQQTQGVYGAPSVNAPLYAARANLVKGTEVEAQALTPAMQQLGQTAFGTLPDAVMPKAVSIFQGLNPTLRRDLEQRLEMAYASRGACVMNFEATAPLGYVALGDMLQEKFGKFNPSDAPNVQAERADKMKDYVRRRAQYAVISHEMGHSIGERHNFVSSSDAWNFRPQYWLLRTNAKQFSKTPCKDGDDGKSCVGPRWMDPVTPNESKNLIHMWAQSSTMEYPGEPSQDLMALGRYDFGAARMFYGEVATVYADAKWKSNTDAGAAAEDHQDDFGGLLGYRFNGFSNPIHYSQLDGNFDMIEKCSSVTPADYQPGNWNEEKDGKWHQVMDGHIVTDESGKPMRCTEPKVDFVQWTQLKDDTNTGKYMATTSDGRVRVPHGFASDDWADLGNIAVYRHDNGADIYEQMQFWQAQQEVTHIFTNYRRSRTDFSIWGAFNRTLSRYHEKMRDSAKAIALYVTLARDTVSQYNGGADPQGFVADVLQQVAEDNTVASSIAFDHFAHVFTRPEPGDHGPLGTDDPVLRSFSGTAFANPGQTVLAVPNGVTGGYGTISLGGRPIENALASNKGRDNDRDYTLNVGSYYEKAFTAMLFSESADNFISAQRDDFVDPRFRAVSVADVFPDGYRRFLSNMLTGDDTIKGVYVRGTGGSGGVAPPDLDPQGYATLGNTQWWPTTGVETCFPQGEKLTCADPFSKTAPPATGVGPVVDPQVGWEQQKFLILFTMLYLPENDRVNWLDQLQIYQQGPDAAPASFENRIEYHSPDGRIFIARTNGTETIMGKTVQKAIGARVLEYANSLLPKAMAVDTVVGKTATWYIPKLDAAGNYTYLQPAKGGGTVPVASCDQSRDCTKLMNYTAIPKFLNEAAWRFGFTRNGGDLKGVY